MAGANVHACVFEFVVRQLSNDESWQAATDHPPEHAPTNGVSMPRFEEALAMQSFS
jgi:hypothetical protein